MTNEIALHGSGPFDLPMAQQARASAGSDAVTLAFRVADPLASHPVTVRIAVPNSHARELADQIARAAAETDEAK